MNGRPAFFEPIRQRAALRWEQLEKDPELAGPWHQLFKQVQSPRHILSELLQNADDVGATVASVRIEGDAFVFEHDGADFQEDHFASLCRFGYSNKRALHTIGFRGIGFKSTFSLGDAVELCSPTLAVVFDKRRFTEPAWLDAPTTANGLTRVRVLISDEHRRREVEKNLEDWLKSPVSLLFFKHIRCLWIANHELRWESLGPGPVQGSEWMALNGNADESFLLARSDDKPFPPETLAEIRQERLVGEDQLRDFPPCKVEIVMGAKGRLYVVLPTGVETNLPFACNAPFIQDPARLKIKDPETSPTNRWLLERIGELAASVLLRWLNQASLSLVERSGAYWILPDVDREDSSLEGVCATTVVESFDGGIGDAPYVLTHDGALAALGKSVVIPDELFEIWPDQNVAGYFDVEARPALSRHVSVSDQTKLLHWKAIGQITRPQVVTTLQTKSLPKPGSWKQLLTLWAYVAPDLISYRDNPIVEKLRIIPVHGKEVLCAADEVVRLGEKRLVQSDADWEFIASQLLAINQNWLRYLAEQRRESDAKSNDSLKREVEAAHALLRLAGIEEASDVSKVVEKVASSFFKQTSNQLPECIRLAQIASKLGASVGESFRFATQDRKLRSISHVVLSDPTGMLQYLFPDDWGQTHMLHEDYSTAFQSCTREEWSSWVGSGRAGLAGFAPIAKKQNSIVSRSKIEPELARRRYFGQISRPFVTQWYRIDDWDFDADLWRHWASLAKEDESFWAKLLNHVLNQPEAFWNKARQAHAFQIATTGRAQVITSTNTPVLPEWILRFSDLPCLSDTRGFHRKPADLMRRTPETESLMDIELFVDGRLDTESTRPLLDLLGVRKVPTGPERLLEILRALSKADKPPVHEVERWYRRLDQMALTCSSESFSSIRQALSGEKLVLAEDSTWATGASVFLSSDEDDVPGAPIIRSSVADLTLWRKIGIAERPTADLAIEWLKTLPQHQTLPPEDLRRMRVLLSRHAPRIWHDCGSWLNLANEWVPTDALRFALTMRTLVTWGHLHYWVKKATADFQRLPSEHTESQPFSDVPPLAAKIEDRFELAAISLGQSERKPWIDQLGIELGRIELDDESEQFRVRELASDLSVTRWQEVSVAEIVPYIDGVPVGTAKAADVVWNERILYVRKLPNARLARLVPDRLGKIFVRPDIAAALSYCYGRSVAEVTEYMEENFLLTHRIVPVPEAKVELSVPPDNAAVLVVAETSEMEPSIAVPEAESTTMPGEPTVGTPIEPVSDFNPDDLLPEPEPTEVPPPKPPPLPKPVKPSVIDRYAQNCGFRKTGEDRYEHSDGSLLIRCVGETFSWQRVTAVGEVTHHYWPKDHCLELEPLQIDTEIWGMVDKYPRSYALILTDAQGKAVEILGERLKTMRESGRLTLHPATYRLVYEHEHEH